MPFDATGFEEDLPSHRRRSAAAARIGRIILALPIAVACWAAWGVLREAADAFGWTFRVIVLAHVALVLTTAVMVWPVGDR